MDGHSGVGEGKGRERGEEEIKKNEKKFFQKTSLLQQIFNLRMILILS